MASAGACGTTKPFLPVPAMVVRCSVVLGEIISKVLRTGFPFDAELALHGTVTDRSCFRDNIADVLLKGVTLELTDAARAHLAEKGFDRLFGARPMARLIEREIKKPLAEEILFGRLRDGGKVVADVKDDELVLDFQ